MGIDVFVGDYWSQFALHTFTLPFKNQSVILSMESYHHLHLLYNINVS